MGVRCFTTKFSELAEDNVMRCDEKFFSFSLNNHWYLYPENKSNTIQLKEILKGDYNVFNLEEDEEYKGIPTGGGYVDEDGDINDYQTVNLDNCPGRIKYSMTNDNIAISSLRLAKAPAIYFEDLDLSNYIFSNGYYIFKVRNNWNKKFVLYLLRMKRIKKIIDNHIYRGIGISAYREEDLLKIKVPDVSVDRQNEIVEKIRPIENRIAQLKSTIKPVQEITNLVFMRELGFDEEEFTRQRNIPVFETKISDFGKNKDLRNSCKFHRPSAYMLQEFLNKKTNLKLKHFLKEDIVLGAGISPKDFDETGTAYYVSMATIKTYEIKLDDTQLVSEEYYASNKGKSILKNDIIIARSGVAIGKTAIAEEDFDGVFADFTMRIRVNPDKCIPLFAYYYIRSRFFQYLIEVHKKGLQNQNIFPAQIQEFPFPNFSLTEQKRIVEEIQTEIDKQNEIREQIQQERNKIDEIIESVVRN